MKVSSVDRADFRFGEYGPGYVARGPRTDMGFVRLRPGDEAANHYHERIEEDFYVIQGEATLWVDGSQSFTMHPGDMYQMEPGEMHYFINEYSEIFLALFVKAPYDPADGVKVPWRPGEDIQAKLNEIKEASHG